MKAVVLHEYGKPSNLKWEDFPDPKPGKGEVLVSVQAASLNPVDLKMRSGAAAEHFPVTFPGVLGRDCAGLVREVGEDVEGFEAGDRVFALTWGTYAELCLVKASELAKIPDGMEMTTAAAIPLVSVTGDQLVREAANVQPGETIVLTAAVGSVGRCALWSANEMGVKVIAGVRKQQMDEARALGAVEAIDVNDDLSLAQVGMVDAVADALNGEIAMKLMAKVKPGGRFGSVLGVPKNAALHPTVDVHAFTAHPDPATYVRFAEAVRDGRLELPIDRVMPMEDAAEAHAVMEKGGVGKIVLRA